MDEMLTWASLPLDVMCTILSLLSHKDLLQVGLVCKAWLILARHDNVWRLKLPPGAAR